MNAVAFTNVRLVCPAAGEHDGALLVRDGTIVASGMVDVPDDAAVIDGGGLLLVPALVDLGVFAVDVLACHAGGIVRIGLMPDQSPVLDDPGVVQRAALIGRPDLWIHPIAAATRGLAGMELAEMAINAAAGAKAVGTGARWIADSAVMRRVLAYAADLNIAIIAHAEDGGLVGNAVATTGENGDPAGPARRPGAGRGAGSGARPDAGGGDRRAAAPARGQHRRRVRPDPRGQGARRTRDVRDDAGAPAVVGHCDERLPHFCARIAAAAQ